jgi:hypothetical protein
VGELEVLMGGDSDSKKKSSTPTKAAEPAIPGTGPMMTQPAFMGDNQNMLAEQLAAGGYGNMPDLMAMLTQTFTPMQVLDTRPGATPAPTTPTPTTPTTPASNTPSWWNGEREPAHYPGGMSGVDYRMKYRAR